MIVTRIKKLLPVGFQIFLLVLGVTILTTAFLELIFAPEATFKHYFPALLMRVRKPSKVQNKVYNESLILLYYIISLLVQVTRSLSSIALFLTLSTSNNQRGWLLYPKFSLLSVALSLSLLLSW